MIQPKSSYSRQVKRAAERMNNYWGVPGPNGVRHPQKNASLTKRQIKRQKVGAVS